MDDIKLLPKIVDETPLITSTPLEDVPYEVRVEREIRLMGEMDNRTPLEKLFDHITAARIRYHRPWLDPSGRRDIPCLCCGCSYRPNDILDAENLFCCATCILERRGG